MPDFLLQEFIDQQVELYGDELVIDKEALVVSGSINIINVDEPVSGDWKSCLTLLDLENSTSNCTQCALAGYRQKFVFGQGNPNADIMVIGGAPDISDNQQGQPLTGAVGGLFDKILAAINLDRSELYICNVLKCYSKEHLDFTANEVDHCKPYLFKQIELVSPKYILGIGNLAGQVLLHTNQHVNALRNKIHTSKSGTKIVVTHHPETLLNNQNLKRETWADVQLFQEIINNE